MHTSAVNLERHSGEYQTHQEVICSVTSRAGCVGLVVRKLISTAKRRAPATTRSSLSTPSKCRRTEIPTNLTLSRETRVTHLLLATCLWTAPDRTQLSSPLPTCRRSAQHTGPTVLTSTFHTESHSSRACCITSRPAPQGSTPEQPPRPRASPPPRERRDGGAWATRPFVLPHPANSWKQAGGGVGRRAQGAACTGCRHSFLRRPSAGAASPAAERRRHAGLHAAPLASSWRWAATRVTQEAHVKRPRPRFVRRPPPPAGMSTPAMSTKRDEARAAPSGAGPGGRVSKVCSRRPPGPWPSSLRRPGPCPGAATEACAVESRTSPHDHPRWRWARLHGASKGAPRWRLQTPSAASSGQEAASSGSRTASHTRGPSGSCAAGHRLARESQDHRVLACSLLLPP